MRRCPIPAVLCLVLVACSSGTNGPDGGSVADSGTFVPDAGSSDAGLPDSGTGGDGGNDAGAPDGGVAGGFEESGLVGGGFQNVVAVGWGGSGTVLSGADVAGVQRSTDRGAHFVPSNDGLVRETLRGVASLVYHPTLAGRVYACVAHAGSSGVYASSDDGVSWTLLSNMPNFNAGNTFALTGEPQEHPRSTGTLLAVDLDPSGAQTLYAATFSKGLMKSTDDGQSWTVLGLAGDFLRGIALIRQGGSVAVYVADHGKGVYKWTPTGGLTPLGGSPSSPEELVAINGTLYVAGGRQGLFATSDGGQTWQPLNQGVGISGPDWESIAGAVVGGKVVLYAGCAFPSGGVSILKSPDGGASWAAVLFAGSAGIHNELGGPLGDVWWLSQPAAGNPALMPGTSAYVASQIQLDPANPDRVFVAGRSGVWRTENGGADWYPMVSGMGVTVNNGVLVDPHASSRVYVANTDYTFFVSTDRMGHVAKSRSNSSGTQGFSLALDTTTSPSTVIVGSGNRDTDTQGEVYSNASAENASSWVNEGLSSVAQGNKPLGLAVGYVAGQRVLLAAVEEPSGSTTGTAGAGGIYRKAGSAWAKVSTSAMTQPEGDAPVSMVWIPGTQVVYLFQHSTGLWRSTDAGQSWTAIWSKPAPAPSGALAAVPNAPHDLYVSTSDGVYRLSGADSGAAVGNGVASQLLGVFPNAGPVTVDPVRGTLYAASIPSPAVGPRISRWNDPLGGWVDLQDATYRNAFGQASGIGVGSDGWLYVSLQGNGVLRRAPSP